MKNTNATYISVFALIFSTIALAMCVMCCYGKQDEQKGIKTTLVERALMEKPEIIINAMNKYQMQMQEQSVAQSQKLIDENINAINNDPNSPILGNPDGKITLVMFFDYACGYCHKLFPGIQNILKNNPDVKFVAKELAFVSQASEYAARAAWAAMEQGKYEELLTALMESNEPLSKERVDALAAKVGLDVVKMKAAMDSGKVKGMLEANNELAQTIQVHGVPTLVLNGKMLQTIDESVIQAEIDTLK